MHRYRASLDNLLVTDFIRFAVFRPDVGRLEVPLVETPGRLAAGSHTISQQVLIQLSHVLGAFFTASAPSATSAEQLADGLAKRATLMRAPSGRSSCPTRKRATRSAASGSSTAAA